MIAYGLSRVQSVKSTLARVGSLLSSFPLPSSLYRYMYSLPETMTARILFLVQIRCSMWGGCAARSVLEHCTLRYPSEKVRPPLIVSFDLMPLVLMSFCSCLLMQALVTWAPSLQQRRSAGDIFFAALLPMIGQIEDHEAAVIKEKGFRVFARCWLSHSRDWLAPPPRGRIGWLPATLLLAAVFSFSSRLLSAALDCPPAPHRAKTGVAHEATGKAVCDSYANLEGCA